MENQHFSCFLLFGQTRYCHILLELKKNVKQKKTAKKRVKKQDFSCFFVVLEKQLGHVGIVFGIDKKSGSEQKGVVLVSKKNLVALPLVTFLVSTLW